MEQEIWKLIEENKNWGRWGSEDERGTVNHITNDVKLEALKIPTDGKQVSLARTIEFFTKTPDVIYQSQRHMLECGIGRDNDDEYANAVGASRSASKEQISLVFHGYTVTHMDSFSHIFWKGKMYNDKPASLVTLNEGAKVNNVEAFRDGIITRGVLLDIPLLKNKSWLELGETFTRDDLEKAEQLCNVKIKKGDMVFVRTGYWKRRSEKGPINPPKDGTPGPHPNISTLLFERQVALFGSDTCNDVFPPLVSSIKNPFHMIALVSMGMPLLDNADLEQLSQECAKRNKWEFLVTISPLAIQGGTGSPINPVAMF